jgi:hypothetical protein
MHLHRLHPENRLDAARRPPPGACYAGNLRFPPTDDVSLFVTCPSPVFGEKAECDVKDTLRNWYCRNCGRSNQTVIAQDGTARCEYCANVTRIQPSRVRGYETPAQLSIPYRKDRRP